MGTNLISRPALGSSAYLGDVYDARTDTFCRINIFKKEIPKTALRQTDNPFSQYRFVHSHNFAEKCSKLDISGEIQGSLLANMISVEGSGRFLYDKSISAKAVQRSLVYRLNTVQESLNFAHEELQDCYSEQAIDIAAKFGTHVVQEISWGANIILSCTDENRNNEDEKKLGGKLTTKLELTKKLLLQNLCDSARHSEDTKVSKKSDDDLGRPDDFTTGPTVKTDQKGAQNIKDEQIDIQMFGDVLPKGEELPTDMKGAINLMKKLPTLMTNCNEGKGRQISYALIPIAQVQMYRNQEMKVENIFEPLEESYLKRIVQVFDQMNDAQQKIYDLYEDAQTYRYCIKPEDLERISKLHHETVQVSFCPKLAKVLSEVRSNPCEIKNLDELFEEILNSKLDPAKVNTELSKWSKSTEKINFARLLDRNGVMYIGHGKCLEDELLENTGSPTFIFYFTDNSKSEDRIRWNKNRHLLIEQVKKNGEDCKYYAVDCGIQPDLRKLKMSSYVQFVKGGRILEKDLLGEKEKFSYLPLARATSGTVRSTDKPTKRAPFYSPCTGIKCDVKHAYEWTCQKCMQKMEYGFDKTVICGCGQTPAEKWEFRCTDENHGIDFQKHDESSFTKILEGIRPFKDINILLVGETGVGKSTWINGFYNFLQFESLAEAEKEDLSFLISETDHEPFKASTEKTMVYRFKVASNIIRLIDTPGIGTDAGVMQDKLYLQNLFATVSDMEIHAICVFFRANDAKHNVKVRYCVSEIMSSFSLDAEENIVFCFTHCRNTNYDTGDTLPILKTVIENEGDEGMKLCESNVYCFDMESIDYLAKVKGQQEMTFSDDNKVEFGESWERSFQETNRMLAHIRDLQPHNVKNSIALNLAREYVLEIDQLEDDWKLVRGYYYGEMCVLQGDSGYVCITLGIHYKRMVSK